ncbi:Protein mesA [Neolecta irregularis DAH-3]|uniref:Protein mesA n=1 Tax=Neolecta irregularis (strain DAH-3) TaxID=1198029 RepID=A0A1U7LH49_NEOID|nr:Protein mesA [Neolecta irregularis DAH-3]|eukprot:OLL21974.1 Protein mesA [Neolecta irregularis DAH-3]
MAICTRHSFLHIYKPVLLLALEEYFRAPHVQTLADLYTAVNSMNVDHIPTLSPWEQLILLMSDNKDMFRERSYIQPLHRNDLTDDRATLFPIGGQTTPVNDIFPKDTHEYETKVVYNGINVPIRVPVATAPGVVGDCSVITLINTFSKAHLANPLPFPYHPYLTSSGPSTHPIIVLLNALLTEQRVMFLGHGLPSGVVANHVLAACALASGCTGLLRGFTERTFPYTDLSKVDSLLCLPGFIAGVTNPTFENHPSWWDVLCNIETGRIKISPEIEMPTQLDKMNRYFPNGTPSSDLLRMDTLDNAFMDEIYTMIQSHSGESAVRARWRDWILRFIQMASAYEELAYGSSAVLHTDTTNFVIPGQGWVWSDDNTKLRDLTVNMMRFEGWKKTASYRFRILDTVALCKRPISVCDVDHHFERLRRLKEIPASEVSQFFFTLRDNVTEIEQLNELLCSLPQHKGGLSPLALGLFHPDFNVRQAVVDILERLERHIAGRHFINAMNRFQKLALIRLKQEKGPPIVG